MSLFQIDSNDTSYNIEFRCSGNCNILTLLGAFDLGQVCRCLEVCYSAIYTVYDLKQSCIAFNISLHIIHCLNRKENIFSRFDFDARYDEGRLPIASDTLVYRIFTHEWHNFRVKFNILTKLFLPTYVRKCD